MTSWESQDWFIYAQWTWLYNTCMQYNHSFYTTHIFKEGELKINKPEGKKTWTYRKRKINPQKKYKKWYSMISLAYIHNNRNFILLVSSPVISVNAMSDSSLYSLCPKTATEAPWWNESYLILTLVFLRGGGGASHQVNMLLN